MKKILLLSLLAILSIGMVNAEPFFGLRGGLNISNYSEGDADSKVGFHAGMMMQYDLHPMIVLQPELLYTQRGASVEFTTLGIETEVSQTLHYVELPIFVKLDLGEGNMKVQPYLGPEFRYLIKGNQKITINGDEGDTNEIDGLNEFDYGMGAGIDLLFNTNMLVGVRYSMSMGEIFEEDSFGFQNDSKNTSLMVNLGFLY